LFWMIAFWFINMAWLCPRQMRSTGQGLILLAWLVSIILFVFLCFSLFFINRLLYHFMFYFFKRFHWSLDCPALRVCLWWCWGVDNCCSYRTHRWEVPFVSRLISFPLSLLICWFFYAIICFPLFRGRLECELKGVFVAQFKELLRGSYQGLPVVVMQFGRVNSEGGSCNSLFTVVFGSF